MIVRMSKIEIIGPKQFLQDVLTLVSSLGIFQVEPSKIGFVEKGQEEELKSFALDEKTLFERLFLEGLKEKIEKLFSYLPKMPVRKSYLDPQSIIGTIAYTVEKHVAACRDLEERKESLHRELAEQRRYSGFLYTLESLFRDSKTAPDLDVIGLTIKDPGTVEQIQTLLSKLTDGKFKLFTVPAENGTLGGLITVEKTLSAKVSRALSSEHIPEMPFPESFDLLSLAGKIGFLQKRTSEIISEIEGIDREIEKICLRWWPIYSSVYNWIGERFALLTATASVFQTRMCFFINGWMPTADIAGLRKSLISSFGNQLVIVEKEMLQEDLERVPVMIKNPPYFKPFELFVRLLPLPSYTSLDPTPFIGIFFPVFFGMILGDAGYGLFLLVLSIVVKKRFAAKRTIQDGAKILFISSLYTIFFGILYGEFFGDLPQRFFGIGPICVERRTAVIPMLYFTLTVGVVHILLGLFLGIITALKKEDEKGGILQIPQHSDHRLSDHRPCLFLRCLPEDHRSAGHHDYPFFDAASPLYRGASGAAGTPEEHRQYHLLCQNHGHRSYVGPSRLHGKPYRRLDRKHRPGDHGGGNAPSSQYHPRRFFTIHPLPPSPLRRVLQQVPGARRKGVPPSQKRQGREVGIDLKADKIKKGDLLQS